MSQGNRNTDVLSASTEGNPVLIPNTGADTLLHRSVVGEESIIRVHISYPENGSGVATVQLKIGGISAFKIRMMKGSVFEYGPCSLAGASGGTKDVEMNMTGGSVSLEVTGFVEFGGLGRRFRP